MFFLNSSPSIIPFPFFHFKLPLLNNINMQYEFQLTLIYEKTCLCHWVGLNKESPNMVNSVCHIQLHFTASQLTTYNPVLTVFIYFLLKLQKKNVAA